MANGKHMRFFGLKELSDVHAPLHAAEISKTQERNESSSADSTSPRHLVVVQLENDEKETTEGPATADHETKLHHAPTTLMVEDEGGDYSAINSFHDAKVIYQLESRKLWAIATPIAFNMLCNYGTNSFTNIFVGHIGDMELSAVALGMGSALETLCGQAFGAGQIEMLGVYMQRSWIILTLASFCILPLYIWATPLLKLLGQRDDIADLAGKFSIQILPQMFSLALNFPTQKFLQAQSKVNILAWMGFCTLIIHIGLLYVFMEVFRLGTVGAAASYNLSAWGIAVAQVVYVLGWCKQGWRGFSWLALKDLWAFVKLSVASAVMICLEIWYFMNIIVLTGNLEDPKHDMNMNDSCLV
ncbi:Multi antimicrobial extrusion protein [Cynara cardunculus var. scolymus]|uniref:Multi antimicrobial extrusion protein n=1 Tax=Cynara cardunculus var. scolymus TaxID=59895 RepID=A0A103XUU2_CYNCS|nr:Multi antimicrobial extrusion protein [Cynara cardunculus var. scolymus]